MTFSSFANSEITKTCSICLENIENASQLQFSCNHIFHINCGIKWLSAEEVNSGKQSCPMCRKKMDDSVDQFPSDLITKKIKYVSIKNDQLNNFFLTLGGRQLSKTTWKNISGTEYFIEDSAVLTYHELKVFCVANGCKKMQDFDMIWNLLC